MGPLPAQGVTARSQGSLGSLPASLAPTLPGDLGPKYLLGAPLQLPSCAPTQTAGVRKSLRSQPSPFVKFGVLLFRYETG